MQTLVKADNKKLEVEATFGDSGEVPSYGMSGGQRMLLSKGTPARPIVHMGVSLNFFYDDGTPVEKKEDVEWIPERMRVGNRIINPRELALKQIEAREAALARGEKPPKAKGGVRIKQAKPMPQRIEISGSKVLGPRGGTKPERATDPDRVTE